MYTYSGTKGEKVQMYGRDNFHDILNNIFGSRFLEYRNNWDRAGRLEYLPEFPLFLDVEPEYQCNMRCIMCIHSLPKTKNPWAMADIMAPDLYERICKEGAAFGLPAITVSNNNEGLLEKYLFEYIDIAARYGVMDIFLGTNGLLLTKEMSQKLISSKITRLLVSIDAASEETYKKIRCNDYFKIVEGNINTFYEERKKVNSSTPLLRVSFVKTSVNQHEIESFRNRWIGKADIISIQDYISPWLFWDSSDKLIVNKEIKDKDPSVKKQCSAIWQRMTIRANGDVLACCNMRNELVLGNVDTQSIYDIWHGKEMNALREVHASGDYKKIKICRECL